MHRTDFIKAVARETGLPPDEVAQVLRVSFDLIARALARGERVVLTGFGTFEMRRRAARRGVNPRTGETITVATTHVPGFTASHRLKAVVRGSEVGGQGSGVGESA